MKYISVGLLALGFLAGCATSSTSSDGANLDEGKQQECRSIYTSGSMLPERVCFDTASANAVDAEKSDDAP